MTVPKLANMLFSPLVRMREPLDDNPCILTRNFVTDGCIFSNQGLAVFGFEFIESVVY